MAKKILLLNLFLQPYIILVKYGLYLNGKRVSQKYFIKFCCFYKMFSKIAAL